MLFIPSVYTSYSRLNRSSDKYRTTHVNAVTDVQRDDKMSVLSRPNSVKMMPSDSGLCHKRHNNILNVLTRQGGGSGRLLVHVETLKKRLNKSSGE